MKKKETVNPITAFRKANEARKATVMKSLKKAQDGIAQDTSAAQTLYKNTKPLGGKANFDTLDPVRNIELSNQQNARKAEMNNQSNARMSSSQMYDKQQMAKDQYNAALKKSKENLSKEIKNNSDALMKKAKSTTPMMDSMYSKKKGGSVKKK